MRRTLLIIAMLVLIGGPARSTQNVYPPLTRETLVGTWETMFGIGTINTVFHFVIAPDDRDSYLSEIYPKYMTGRLFRLERCTVLEGKIKLSFRCIEPNDNSEWWFEGEGYGDEKEAWIKGTFGTAANPRGESAPNLYMEKGTWVRRFGEASTLAEKKIRDMQNQKK